MTAQADERVAVLRDRVRADFPEAWIPEGEGDELIGYFQRIDYGNTSYGRCPIAVFADPTTGTERAVWLLHTVLRNELIRVRPAAGELVAIRYLGRREPTGGGQAYESYRVVVDRPASAVSWDDLATDDVPAPAAESAPLGDTGLAGDDEIPF